MSAVVDAVTGAVDAVVDAVGDVADFAVSNVENIVTNAIDDPLKTAAQVAAIVAAPATGGASLVYGLPAIEAVDVYTEGGSLGDAAQAAAISYAISQGVTYGMDALGASGMTTTTGSGTQSFFPDGSYVQYFDDGSTLSMSANGVYSSTAATDWASPFMAGIAGGVDDAATAAAMAGADDVAAAAAQGVDDIPPSIAGISDDVSQPGQPMMSADDLAYQQYTPPPDDVFEPAVSSPIQMPMTADDLAYEAYMPPMDDTFTPAKASPVDLSVPTPTNLTPEEIMANIAAAGGAAATASVPQAPGIGDTIMGGIKDAGAAVKDFAKEYPVATTLGVSAGLGALTAKPPEIPQMPELEKKTYTYGTPPTLAGETFLEGVNDASLDAYRGYDPMQQVPGQPVGLPSLRTEFGSLLGAPLPDISLAKVMQAQEQAKKDAGMSPEDIIRAQESRGRKD